MNYRKERLIENFIFIMFPVTLLVACTTNGNEELAGKQLATTEETLSIIENEKPIVYANQSDLMFQEVLTEQVNDTAKIMSLSIGETEENKYVIISPSMHLAIYKTTEGENEDMRASIQTAHLKTNLREGNLVNLPSKSIYRFESDAYDVSEEDLLSLKAHAEFLIENPQFNLTVGGHTDHTGSDQHNQLLSEQRAQLVSEILLTFGAPASQIIVEGYGESVPINSIDNLEENRRVELEYSKALMVSAM